MIIGFYFSISLSSLLMSLRGVVFKGNQVVKVVGRGIDFLLVVVEPQITRERFHGLSV